MSRRCSACGEPVSRPHVTDCANASRKAGTRNTERPEEQLVRQLQPLEPAPSSLGLAR